MRKTNRQLLLEWAEQSSIDQQQLKSALHIGEVFPSINNWRGFLDKLLLYVGALFVASGIVFFFAYNWDELGRFAQFALVQGAIVIALLAFWRLGLDKLSGKVSLMLAAIFVGVLLALIGQTYQTGADTYELFVVWCALILPWAILAHFDVLWMFWLLLLNLSITLYYKVFGGLFHVLLGAEQMLWVLFIVNAVALLVWEFVVTKGADRRRVRWVTRLLATASGGLISTLAILNLLSSEWTSLEFIGVLAWAGWMACIYYWYRNIVLDVYVLALGILSVISVVSVLLGRFLFDGHLDVVVALLVMSIVVIGLSASGALWLRGVITGEQS